MLTYEFVESAGMPLYEQLYRKIRDDITCGTISSGAKLPSKRTFAKHLGISTITVENAYAQLLMEGYIISRPRKGYFAASLAEMPGRRPDAGEDRSRSERSVSSAAVSADTGRDREYFADFAVSQNSHESFPFTTWARLFRDVLSNRQKDLMTKPPQGGVWELRTALAEYLKDFRGVEADPGQIIVGAGTEYLYGLLVQLLGFERIYACEDPGYRKAADIFEAYRVQCRHIPLDASGICMRDLEMSGADVVHVTPSHHFPTGITMPAGRRYELLSWAASGNERYIIEDDYDSELRMSGKPLPSLFGMDSGERTIYMNTFTKTLSSTIRVSYMILPPLLLEKFETSMGFYSCTVPTFEQYTLARFIRDGFFEKHINRVRNASRKKQDKLLKAIRRSRLGPLVNISAENAGLHFLMTIDYKGTKQDFMERCEGEGIHLVSLQSYEHAPRPEDANVFVIHYASIPEDRFEEAADRLYRAASGSQERT